MVWPWSRDAETHISPKKTRCLLWWWRLVVAQIFRVFDKNENFALWIQGQILNPKKPWTWNNWKIPKPKHNKPKTLKKLQKPDGKKLLKTCNLRHFFSKYVKCKNPSQWISKNPINPNLKSLKSCTPFRPKFKEFFNLTSQNYFS